MESERLPWSEWRPFPDPREGGILVAPLGPGVYELRLSTGQLVLVGCARNAAFRMTSLLPRPWGQGTRKNTKKREFALQNIATLEYRTCACVDAEQARFRVLVWAHGHSVPPGTQPESPEALLLGILA